MHIDCFVSRNVNAISIMSSRVLIYVIQSLEAVRSETTYCILAKDLGLIHDEILRKLRMTYCAQDDILC